MKRFLIIFAALLLALGAVTLLLPIKSIDIEGRNSYYSENELKAKIREGKSSRALIFFLQEKLMKHKPIPFIEKYTVSFKGFRHLRVTVYEKSLIGYLRFQQYYLYFDWDGTVVESSTLRLPGIPEVIGLGNASAVLGEKIASIYPDSFNSVMTVTQFLGSNEANFAGKKMKLSDLAESIHFSPSGISVVFGEITVFFGSSDYLQDKLSVMCDSLPELYGRSGTLYLDSYRPGQQNPSYIFK